MDIARAKRRWLWPLGRLTGLLPISFKECGCTSRAPFATSRAGSEHAVGEATLPSSWDLPQPGRVTASRCSCVVAERSIPWLAYSFGVVLVLVPSAVYGLFRDAKNATSVSKPSLRMQSPTDVMVTCCDILSVVLCSVVCFAQLALTQSTLFEVLEHLQQVDRWLSVRPPAVPGLLALWLVLLVGVVVTDGHMWAEIGDLAYASTYFPFYIVYFLTFMMEVLFIDDAHGIYMRFAALNEKLDQALALPTYQAATEQQPFGAADGWIGEASRSTAVSITGIADSNALYSSKASNNSNARRARLRPGGAVAVALTASSGLPLGAAAAPPLTVQRLNMAHHVLCETSGLVARRYGLCLLVDMPCILLHLVITAYFFLKQLMNVKDPITPQYVVVQCLWLAVHLMRLLMIVLPCSRASAEANRTGALVGVVLSTASPYTVAHKQLESFSIQLLHHKVNFNACGLFELGLPLVVSILGAVTTYLVVLLQLKGNPPGTNSTATAAPPVH